MYEVRKGVTTALWWTSENMNFDTIKLNISFEGLFLKLLRQLGVWDGGRRFFSTFSQEVASY